MPLGQRPRFASGAPLSAGPRLSSEVRTSAIIGGDWWADLRPPGGGGLCRGQDPASLTRWPSPSRRLLSAARWSPCMNRTRCWRLPPLPHRCLQRLSSASSSRSLPGSPTTSVPTLPPFADFPRWRRTIPSPGSDGRLLAPDRLTAGVRSVLPAADAAAGGRTAPSLDQTRLEFRSGTADERRSLHVALLAQQHDPPTCIGRR